MLYVGRHWANLQLTRGGIYYAGLGGTARVVSNAAAVGAPAAGPAAPAAQYLCKIGQVLRCQVHGNSPDRGISDDRRGHPCSPRHAFDFDRPIAIPIDRATQAARLRYQAEFPAVASLMVVRVSTENSILSQNAAQFIARKLQADKTNIGQVFIPGLGAFYDRFGFLYLPADDINSRVERVKRLRPLFQAIAASPNLAGLSTLVNQVAEVVQRGRSPQGLESLFVQMSDTIKKQVSNKPAPLDWPRVAGLRIETKNKEWVVVVQPQAGRLQEARIAIEASPPPC